MHNNNEFNKKLKDFIGSDKRMALVKGYVNEYKLTTVLRALNNSDYTKGTIHTRSIGNLKQIVDETIIYDLKQEDPKQYEILYKNKHGKLPY
ncbi:hypothetical protein L4932_07660 [Staphylococcus aureus]|uniref:hypothetical protein n=1 Tax=Staphylococcus aureus TaxID=1280 RepID=UPI000BBBBAF1|nr:hypothetical protein [Staphylococcus aureus]MDN4123156.1 hypothetical protein [Staphylococcus aureus]MVW53930.1 hypothetical protein [Staphylococcus aureus]PCF69095.1 hypothetical protein CKO30_08200 [Staphylococcus aureus]